MKIQLLSDIHLEFNENPYPKVIQDADLLILAGDIGLPHLDRYLEFLQLASKTVANIVLITGNHEYYHSKGFHHIDNKIKLKIDNNELRNVHFLQKNYIDLEGIRILGCTLWTHIPSEHSYLVEKYMSDYIKIKRRIIKNGTPQKKSIGILTVNFWHRDHKKWLEEEIEKSPYPVIIVTHHTPLLHLQKDLTDSLHYGYHSNQLDILSNPKVKLWCCGHTHRAIQTEVDGTLVWCNPVGYPREYTNYDPCGLVTVDEHGTIFVNQDNKPLNDESSSSSFHESDFE